MRSSTLIFITFTAFMILAGGRYIPIVSALAEDNQPQVGLQLPDHVDVGEDFSVIIAGSFPDSAIEARYAGVPRSWIIEHGKKINDGFEFDLPGPFAGTNLTCRALIRSNMIDPGEWIPASNWSIIPVTGWSDVDGDSLCDSWEKLHNLDTDDPNEDTDGDGMILLEEMYALTDPNSRDTDMDGMDDLWEFRNGTLPFRSDQDDDPDGDSWSNIQEMIHETDPREGSDHPREPPATPWYWMVIIAGSLLLIIGYFIKQLFSKDRLESELEEIDRGAAGSRSGKSGDI